MQTLSAFFDRWIKLLLAFFSCCIDLICSCLWASRRKRINDASSSDLSHSLSLSSPPPLSPDHNGVIIAPSETSQTLLTNYDALSPWPHIKDAAAPPLCPGPDHALSLKLASFGPPPGWSHVTDRSARARRWLAERGSRGRIIEVRVDEPPVWGGGGGERIWLGEWRGAGGTNWMAPPVPRGGPARWGWFRLQFIFQPSRGNQWNQNHWKNTIHEKAGEWEHSYVIHAKIQLTFIDSSYLALTSTQTQL